MKSIRDWQRSSTTCMSAALIAIRNTDELGNVSVTATLQHIHCVSGALRKDDTHLLKRCTTSSLYHKAAIIEKVI